MSQSAWFYQVALHVPKRCDLTTRTGESVGRINSAYGALGFTIINVLLCFRFRMLEEKLDEERKQEELRLAERETERVAKKLQLAQEQEASRQLSLAQQGLNEAEKEVNEKLLS